MTNNQLTRKQRAAVVRRQKITLAAGIAVLILVIIFVLAFKGCNSKKKNNDKTVPANTETTTDDNKTTTENNSAAKLSKAVMLFTQMTIAEKASHETQNSIIAFFPDDFCPKNFLANVRITHVSKQVAAISNKSHKISIIVFPSNIW